MSEQKRNTVGKRELLLVLAVLLIAGALFVINHFTRSKTANLLEISKDGEPYLTLELKDDQTYRLADSDDNYNVFEIKGGEVWVSEASCPDKLCMHQGKIKEDGEMLVCLPNRVIAKVIGQEP